MSMHKKTKQNNNYNNSLTIHTRGQKSTKTSAICVNSKINILKSVQDELYLKTALGFSILRSISRKSRELVWAEERDKLREIL